MSISISPMFYRVQKMSLKKHAKLQIIPRWILVNFIGLPWPLNFIHWRMIEVKLLAKTSTAMLKVGNGSFYNANSKGRILWEGTNHVFLGCLSGHFGSWRLFYFMKVWKDISGKKILSRFSSHYRVSSEKIWRILNFWDVPRISIFARS